MNVGREWVWILSVSEHVHNVVSAPFAFHILSVCILDHFIKFTLCNVDPTFMFMWGFRWTEVSHLVRLSLGMTNGLRKRG